MAAKHHHHRQAATKRAPVGYDTHTHCQHCGQRLLVPESQLFELYRSLQRAGAAYLLCTCGSTTLFHAFTLSSEPAARSHPLH